MREQGIEQRSYIRYLVKTGMSGYHIKQKIQEVYGENAISKSSVYKWVKRFSEGREDVTDNGRSGRPATANTEENVERIKELLSDNKKMSFRKIADQLNISYGSTSRIVTENIRKNENKTCFMCLSEDNNLNIIEKTDTEMQHLVYIMPELTTADTKIPIHVCDTCHRAISSFYCFKKMCLENSKRWKQITKTIDKNKSRKPEKQNTNEKPKHIKAEEPEEIDEPIAAQFIKCELLSDPELDIDASDYSETSEEKETKDKKPWIGTCVLCNRSFTDESVFQRHFRMHSEVRNYKCEQCNKSYKRKSHLTRHLRAHSKEVYARKTFKCPGCNSGFVRKLNLKKHMKNVCVKVPPDSDICI